MIQENEKAPVSEVKGFFNPIPMMYININVKNTCVILEKFKDS